MHHTDFGTWLSAIALGSPQDIPTGFLLCMMQKGYCDAKCRIDLSRIPAELYPHCHANLNRPIDLFASIMRDFAQVTED